jgi:hypothetical protein
MGDRAQRQSAVVARSRSPLAFDKGYTVKPRRRPVISWTEAEVMAGIRFEGKAPQAKVQPGPDAELVIRCDQAPRAAHGSDRHRLRPGEDPAGLDGGRRAEADHEAGLWV